MQDAFWALKTIDTWLPRSPEQSWSSPAETPATILI
jgi:hypothetical protein